MLGEADVALVRDCPGRKDTIVWGGKDWSKTWEAGRLTGWTQGCWGIHPKKDHLLKLGDGCNNFDLPAGGESREDDPLSRVKGEFFKTRGSSQQVGGRDE